MPKVDIKLYVKRINDLIDRIKEYKVYKEKLVKSLRKLDTDYKKKKISEERYRIVLRNILKGKKRKDLISYYNDRILRLLDEIEKYNKNITDIFKTIKPATKISLKKKPSKIKKKTVVAPIPEISAVRLSKKVKLKYLKDLNLEVEDVRKFAKPKKPKEAVEEAEYTVYESSSFGKLANSCVENLTFYLVKKFPDFFKNLYKALRYADVRIFSRTYVSIMIFSSLLVFFLTILSLSVFFYFTNVSIIANIFRSLGLGFLGAIITFTMLYVYPYSVIKSRRRGIRNDLPFVIIHMAAVAGSGAQPISMFNLVLSSGEYRWLEAEIKKIVNYVCLFGYDLNTALRAVALTTPSPEFKELLTGIVSVTETGGSLKAYLKGKAEDAMTTYRLERKKFTEVLSTYSDIYTGILIAAPLLFFTTLAIINMPLLGGSIFGLSAATLALIGTYGVIPLMNIAFLIFLNTVQPE